MNRIYHLWRHRNALLVLALILGLFLGQGSRWTEKTVLPALAVVMTLSTMGVSGRIFLSPHKLVMPALIGIAMNYGVLGGLLLGLNALLISDSAIYDGFVIMTAVPPAVAVIPFTVILNGDSAFSLIAAVGCYLGALILTPLITVGFLGTGFVDPGKIVTIMVELILIPLVFSRLLLWTGMGGRIEPLRGTITNWSFFIVVYTIVGLNRELFFSRPWALAPAAFIALASTFLLGVGIEMIGRFFRVDSKTMVSLVLLGTHKNTGLAAGLSLALYSEKTAAPATIATIFMLVYIIWLSFKQRWDKNR